MKNTKYIKFGMLLIFLVLQIGIINSTLESLGTFEKDTNIRVTQVCSDSTYINISSITYPNSSIAISNVEMISSGNGEFYYYFNETYTSGRYDVRGKSDGCDLDSNTFTTYFEITTNGKSLPSGAVIVFFNIFFVVIVGGMLSILLYSIFNLISLDFDAKDLIINISSYFVVFAVYILGKEYLGNKFINDFLLMVIEIGAFTTIIMPIIAFVICFFKQRMDMKKEDSYG